MSDHATAGVSSAEEALPPPQPDSARRPGARERGRMRRRLRQQTRMREALLVDLGALVYELHRHGRREPELLQTKAAELTAVDGEVRALADALDAGYGMLALVSAGIAGSCEHCGSLLGTDARYCSSCGASAVASLASDQPAGGRDDGRGTLADSDPEPLERQERDLDPSTDEIEAVPRPEPEAERAPEPEPEYEEPGHDPAERAPWLGPVPGAEAEHDVDEPDAGPDAAAEPEAEPEPDAEAEPEPPTAASPAYPPSAPPPQRRRRSGGAVGRVSGALKRARKD